MIIYRIISFLILFLGGMIIGASIGLVLEMLMDQSVSGLLGLFFARDAVVMIIGAVIGGALGMYTARVLYNEWKRMIQA